MTRRSPVFLGLARPPKFLGLPTDYLAVLMVGTLLPFVATKSLWFLGAGAVIYPILWVLADREPHFFQLWRSSRLVHGRDHAA